MIKIFRTRIFSYSDTKRLRLRPNYLQHPANAPKFAHHYNHHEENFAVPPCVLTTRHDKGNVKVTVHLFVLHPGNHELLLSSWRSNCSKLKLCDAFRHVPGYDGPSDNSVDVKSLNDE
ncbi:catalase A [Datura stramonium]|uniref:Catalase A n=1 Tax=Datura stramonium TaxID=4076 RepID=A0ABS8RG59_DATST|nr:catalase A [Datura stramonium]